MSQLLLAAQKIKNHIEGKVGATTTSSSAVAIPTPLAHRSSRAPVRHQALHRRQNVTDSALAAARKIVRDAQAEAGARNLDRLANPRRNTYDKRNNTAAALKARAEDIATYTVNATVAAAAALVAEADAANGTLNKPLNFPDKYAKYLNKTTASTSGFGKRDTTWWMENVDHNGLMPFGGDSSYPVFRNVQYFGAKGDGVTDDTAAINAAIAYGNRCGSGCGSSSVKAALVYFPSGTYLVSSPIIALYNTQLVGNPNSLPQILAAPSFVGLGVISSDVYTGGDGEYFINQSNFLRQLRNFVINVGEANLAGIAGLHWQVAQATSVQNVYFWQSSASGSTQIGIFAENGSGGFMSDVVFFGGAVGIQCGNQQFTVRNFLFVDCVIAIDLLWDWGWTWKSITVLGATYGINIRGSDIGGSIYLLDSTFSSTTIGVLVTSPKGATDGEQWQITLDNIEMDSVETMVYDLASLSGLAGGTSTVDSWTIGRYYDADNPDGAFMNGGVLPELHPKTASLYADGAYFERSKPQYEDISVDLFLSAKLLCAGDGVTDDTDNMNFLLYLAAYDNYYVFFPAGSYVVTDTVLFPENSRIVGEAWSQIVAKGANFEDMMNPRAMVKVGNEGDVGVIEVQDLLFTATGPTAGVILVEWNIAQFGQGSAAMWDCHFRLGGALGTGLQAANCPILSGTVKSSCIAGSLMLHLTSSSSIYLENSWAWVADHDMDSGTAATQIDIYVARGMLIESQGPSWLYGTASEHAVLYQYQLNNAQDIFMGMIQTESPYFLPAPLAPAPFTAAVGIFNADPTFSDCKSSDPGCAAAWALRIVDSANIHIAGAGLYNWFQAYTQQCVDTQNCQDKLVSTVESGGVFLYNLYTIGSVEMVSPGNVVNLFDPVLAKDNTNQPSHPFNSMITAWLEFPDLSTVGHAVGDDTDYSACNEFDYTKNSPADVWKYSGAGDFIDAFITSHGAANIMQNLDASSSKTHTNTWDCTDITSDKCFSPTNCGDYSNANKPMYLVQVALSNYYTSLAKGKALMDDSAFLTSLGLDNIVSSFPNPQVADMVSSAQLFSNLGAVLSIISSVVAIIPGVGEGIALAGGITGVAGGVFSEIGANIDDPTSDLSDAYDQVLEDRVNVVFTKFTEGLGDSAKAVFAAGDLSSWPTVLHDTASTGRANDLAAFLDGGRYLEPVNLEDHLADVSANWIKTLVGTQLTSTNYYILHGARTVDDCPNIVGGYVYGGICYTIEYPGPGLADYEFVDVDHVTTQFSRPISQDTLDIITGESPHFNISLADLVTSSLLCQFYSGEYNSNYTFDGTLPVYGTVPNCFYSMTVLIVNTLDGKRDARDSTPCVLYDNNIPDSLKMQFIGSWLPDQLAAIFTEDFCHDTCYDGGNIATDCGVSGTGT